MAISELELRILALELAAVMPELPRICDECARRLKEPIINLPVVQAGLIPCTHKDAAT